MQYRWKCPYHFTNYSHLFLKLLIRAQNPKFSSSSAVESNTIKCTLVLDLVPYVCLLWWIPFLRVFLVSVIGKMVSGAWLDGLVFPCDFWRWNNCHQFTICTGPLPLSGLMVHTVHAVGLSMCTCFAKIIVLMIYHSKPCIANGWCFAPKHQLLRLVTGSAMWHGIVCKYQHW